MVQDATGLWPAGPAEPRASDGAPGPDEPAPVRPAAPDAQPWGHAGSEIRTRVPEQATGRLLDAVV